MLLLHLSVHCFCCSFSEVTHYYCEFYRIRELGLSFENMFEEIPVVIKNSHLMNVALCEIEDKLSTKKTYNNLDMATGYVKVHPLLPRTNKTILRVLSPWSIFKREHKPTKFLHIAYNNTTIALQY